MIKLLSRKPIALLLVILFFFQAEDGIRDPLVTGVQTCALPIWSDLDGAETDDTGGIDAARLIADAQPIDRRRMLRRIQEIGRASCRKEGRIRWRKKRQKKDKTTK